METRFINNRSVAALKASENNAVFQAGTKPTKDGTGVIYTFICGSVDGLISEAAVAHLQGGGSLDALEVAHVIYDGGECEMLMMPRNAGPKQVLWSL